MTILSDRQIRSRCVAPTHQISRISRVGMRVIEHGAEDVIMTDKDVEDLVKMGRASPQFRVYSPTEREAFQAMIEPFEPDQIRRIADKKVISYGTSSYGYDVRCANEFKIFTNVNSTIVDPKNFDDKAFVDVTADEIIIPPNSFALARTVEYFRIPRDVLVICLGKSTYARCGIIVNVTPLEPEWEGHVTLEFSNTTPLPAKIYANEGCAQFLFLHNSISGICEQSYKDRGGKYQGQTGVVTPRM